MQNQPKQKGDKWTIQKTLEWTISYFKSHNIDSPRTAAEILLSNSLNLKRIDLYLRYEQPLLKNELAAYKALILRRIAREPVAYIVGKKEFWSLDFAVTPDVLIPRPETECLIEEILSLVSSYESVSPMRILDIGTGSGVIVVALASERPDNYFFASDRSIKAVRLARQNARYHKVDDKILFFAGDWFDPLCNRSDLFDIIISNPPYIQTDVIPKLEPEVYKYEPVMALDGGADGLCTIRKIICQSHIYLKSGGTLMMEIGEDQQNALKKIIDDIGKYEHVVFKKDYSGHVRIAMMKKR